MYQDLKCCDFLKWVSYLKYEYTKIWKCFKMATEYDTSNVNYWKSEFPFTVGAIILFHLIPFLVIPIPIEITNVIVLRYLAEMKACLICKTCAPPGCGVSVVIWENGTAGTNKRSKLRNDAFYNFSWIIVQSVCRRGVLTSTVYQPKGKWTSSQKEGENCADSQRQPLLRKIIACVLDSQILIMLKRKYVKNLTV